MIRGPGSITYKDVLGELVIFILRKENTDRGFEIVFNYKKIFLER